MDSKKICFIACVNDEETYSECLKYINNLIIPKGFKIETLKINNAKSISAAYNDAMKKSDALYKVYLHQDVFIIKRNFIEEVINIFMNDEHIGMLGMTGAKVIPSNAKWWEGFEKFGKVYESHTGKMKELSFKTIEERYKEVKALDGFLLVTNKNIKWREDIFTGWHFYDISECVEFTLEGYKIVVPKQNEPWCIHDCGFVETTGDYDKYREIFLDEYSKKIFPLVSIMITAYNRPNYFRTALESAVNQTYKNIEIIICDNSTNDKCKNIAEEYINKYENIKYYKNDVELEVIDNFKKCLELANGEYAEYLMDDDIYHIDKTSRMIDYFIQLDDIKLVTSYRQTIDSDGKKISPISETKKLFDEDKIIDGQIIIDFVMKTLQNVIGETTTPLFNRKEVLKNGFGKYGQKQYKVNADLVTWISLLTEGKMVYICDELSYFRMHELQDQKRYVTIIGGINEFLNMLDTYLYEKNISLEEKYKYYDYWKKKCYWIFTLDCSKEYLKSLQKIKKIFNEIDKRNYVNSLDV